MSNPNDKLHWIVLALALLFGAYLRFAGLGTSSFWVDELDFVHAAQSQAATGAPLLPSGYAYPRAPLLRYALVLSYKFLGVSEFSSRLPSAVFGLCIIPLVYIIGRRWFDAGTGLIAAILVSFAPFELGWSRACRMYSLFQLSFLLGIYFFYRGFESEREKKSSGAFTRRISSGWNLQMGSLLLSAAFLLVSYTSHQNAALFVFALLAYFLTMSAAAVFRDGWRSGLRSKYGVLAIAGCAVVLFCALLPAAREFLGYALSYQPHWASVASAQNSLRIPRFLLGGRHLPFNLFMLAGAALIVFRWHKPGIFALLTLGIPILFFTFVFQYRKNDYIYNVYPIFYLVGAYALSRIVSGIDALLQRSRFTRSWSDFQQPGVRYGAALLICLLWLPMTESFKFARKIPGLPDGRFNGAIYHNEWRAAGDFLRPKLVPDDFLMSTLPLSVRHYLGRAEYNLNWSNSDLARQNNIVAPDGRFVDLYSGADVVDSLAALKKVLREHERGWLVVDNYRFANPVYVPKEVHDYLVSNLPRVFETEGNTVSVFRWRNDKNATASN